MSSRIALGGLALFALVVVGWPVGHAVAGALLAAGPARSLAVTFPPILLVESVAWAGLIALAATALGWPGAWAMRRWGWRAAPLVAAPLLMPPYLAYAGWNLVRAPNTWLGGVIERAAAGGFRWAPVAAGRALAVAGLAVWAAPLAAMITALVLRRIDDDLLAHLRLDAGERTLRHRARLALPGLAAAVLLITLLMMGSAVPLHLAQTPTWSVRLWMGLDLTPPREHWRLWARAWPTVVIAAGGVLAFWGLVRPGSAAAAPVDARAGSVRAAGAGLAPAVLGVVIPLALFAAHIRSLASLATFWRISGRAVLDGLVVAGGVAAAAMVLVVLTWGALGAARASRTVAGLIFALAVSALLPGVMVGSAVAGAWAGVEGVRETLVIVVLAHLARFAAVAVLAGAWLHGSEAVEERDVRALDGAGSARGWWAACWPAHRGAILGAGLAAGVLSFFEIESSVVVQPLGMESLSRQLLGHLHFARTDEMSAAGVMLLGAGLLAAGAAGWLAGRTAARMATRRASPGPAMR